MNMIKTFLIITFILCIHEQSNAQTISDKSTALDIQLTLPKIDAHPYHKPFVAVWLETNERAPIATIAVWYDDAEWLKDLRQWWRKLGRKQHSSGQLDGLSGATQKPGTYQIHWQGHFQSEKAYLNIEVAREEGGRSYHRETINLSTTEKYYIAASHEFGNIEIKISQPSQPYADKF